MLSLNLKAVNNIKIGVVRGSIFELRMTRLGLQKEWLETTDTSEQNMKKLLNGRVDYIYSSPGIIKNYLDNEALKTDKDKIHQSEVMTHSRVFVASCKQFDSELYQSVKQSLSRLQENGSLQQIIDKYYLLKPNAVGQYSLTD